LAQIFALKLLLVDAPILVEGGQIALQCANLDELHRGQLPRAIDMTP
jgi:hypothetical protein